MVVAKDQHELMALSGNFNDNLGNSKYRLLEKTNITLMMGLGFLADVPLNRCL